MLAPGKRSALLRLDNSEGRAACGAALAELRRAMGACGPSPGTSRFTGFECGAQLDPASSVGKRDSGRSA